MIPLHALPADVLHQLMGQQPPIELTEAEYALEPSLEHEAAGDEEARDDNAMSDDDLLSACERMVQDALDYREQEAADLRAKITEFFFGMPFGNEIEGESEAISSDVMDGILGMMPGLIEPFVSTEEVCTFQPSSAEDEEGAEQETEYINKVLDKNERFALVYSWLFDGLTGINGIVTYYMDDVPRVRIERYEGLTQSQVVQKIMQSPEVEVVEQRSYPDPDAPPSPPPAMQAAMAAQGQPFQPPMLWDCKLKWVDKKGEPRIENVPHEEFLITSDARGPNPKRARMAGRRREMSISDLREICAKFGVEIDEDDEELTEDGEEIRSSAEYLARNPNRVPGGADFRDEASGASRMVLVHDLYPLIDYDGDGIAERRRVMYCGKKILINEEFEEPPYCGWTPYIIPHRFQGLCPAEQLLDIQIQKSTVLRQGLNNAYAINNGRTLVGKKVNLDDMMNNPVSGFVRVDADVVDGATAQLQTVPIIQQLMPMMDYLDAAKGSRTGFSKEAAGMNADALRDMTAFNGAEMMDAARARIKMIARTFAETGLKDLMVSLHGLVRRHGKQGTMPMRGKWIDVDPRFWINRMDMAVSVGLGTGSKSQTLQAIQFVLAAQKEAMAAGLTSVPKIYNAIAEGVKALGWKNVHRFFDDPSEPGWQQPEQNKDPLVEAEEVKAGATLQKADKDNDTKKVIALLNAAMKAIIEGSKDDGGAAEDRALRPQQGQVRGEMRRIGNA